MKEREHKYDPDQMIKKNREYCKKRDLEQRRKDGNPKPTAHGIGEPTPSICDACSEPAARSTTFYTKTGKQTVCDKCKRTKDLQNPSTFRIRIGKEGLLQ